MGGEDGSTGSASAARQSRHPHRGAASPSAGPGAPHGTAAVRAAAGPPLYDTDRRLADERIIEILAKDGFEGPRYDRFEEELARYGLSVLRGWMHSGYIFALLASHGSISPPEPASSTS